MTTKKTGNGNDGTGNGKNSLEPLPSDEWVLLAVVKLYVAHQLELAVGGEEAGFDGVGGELAHLLEGEFEGFLDQDVLGEQVTAEHRWVVGVEREHQAALEVLADGVLVECGATAGAEVRGDVQLEGDLALGQDREEVGVVLRGQGVADALGADVDGGPDGGGTGDGAGGLARVDGEAETGGAGFGVDLAELLGGAAGFVAADANADDAGVLVAEFSRQAEDVGGLFDAEVADGVDDPEDGGAELALGADAGALDGVHDRGDGELRLEAGEDAPGDVDLGVDDALVGEVADHVVGNQLEVVGGLEALGDGLEGHEEVGEVVVDVEGAGRIEGERSGVVALAQLYEGLGQDGAFEVEVQLGFGQAAEPGGDVDLFELVRFSHPV